MEPFRLRLITNLHCNFACPFCYQKRKPKMVLPLETLRFELMGRRFKRASVMGGEATLLPNLADYIAIAAECCDTVGLTTNGFFLTPKSLQDYIDAGLDEVAISIPSIRHYADITGHSYGEVLPAVEMCARMLPGTRINVTQNDFNMEGEIYDMILTFNTMGLFVVVCEDIARNFVMDFEGRLGAELVGKSHGFLTYRHRYGTFGYFHDYENYDDTDLIVTPVGTFEKWSEYCSAVGLELTA